MFPQSSVESPRSCGADALVHPRAYPVSTAEKFVPYIQLLVGGSNIFAEGTGSYTGLKQSLLSLSFSMSLGADYYVSRRFGWRLQGVLETHFSGSFQSDGRFSTGSVVYF